MTTLKFIGDGTRYAPDWPQEDIVVDDTTATALVATGLYEVGESSPVENVAGATLEDAPAAPEEVTQTDG